VNDISIAVIIPCYNETAAIGRVVSDFRQALPHADIYVYDNNSTDDTLETARKAGAKVGAVKYQGKGNVVRQMFCDIDADVYIMADGDGTYDATSAPRLVEALVDGGLDMVVGIREDDEEKAYRSGHRWGNRVFNGVLRTVFKSPFTDMLSGYRVFSRRFVKSFPALSSGFEVETELSIHAIEMKMPVLEITTPYYSRPEGSHSKLNTYRDGFRILWTIFRLVKETLPLRFFSGVAALLILGSLLLGAPLVTEWLRTGLVPRFPTAILASGIMVLGWLSFACGIILESVSQGRLEQKRMVYSSILGPLWNRSKTN